MSIIKNKKGSSLIEMILVLCVIALFGLGLIPMIISGSNAYGNISKNQLIEGDARIATSFIQMKIKQNDVNGNISVSDSGLGGKALVLKWPEDENISTYIFFNEGKLLEYISFKGAKPDASLSETIAEIESFEISMSETGKEVLFSVGYEVDGKTKKLDSRVEIRSELAGEGDIN